MTKTASTSAKTTPAKTTPAKTTAAKSAAAKRPSKAAPASKPAPTKKVPAAKKAKPTTKPAEKPADKPVIKLVRDSFTMPRQDFDLIAALKKRALALQRPAKKSELLRGGLHVLHKLPDESLLAALEGLVQLKPGRPKKGA